MNCDRSQQVLVDIACGNSDSAEATQARLHADACPDCGALLRKLLHGVHLTASLPLMEPSPQVSDRIMQHARAHVMATRALSTPATQQVEPVASLADRLREFLSQFAMGRQVAMATVMVLVVAVGLWFVPKARHHELAGGNVVNPDPEGEAGPSDGVAPAGGIVPAAPLDLDLRQGRIRTRGEAAEATAPKETIAAAVEAPSVVATTDEGAAAQNSLAEPSAEKGFATPELDDVAGGVIPDATETGHEVASVLRAEAEMAEAEMERKERSHAPSAAETSITARSDMAAESQAFAQPAPAAPTPSAAQAPARRSAAPDAPTLNPYARVAPPPVAADATRGTTAGGGLGSAAGSSTESVITSESPKDADPLALARQAQRSGRCAEAVVHYESYLRTAPRNRPVMLEAAACYRQLGRQADAARWTARAAAVASSVTSNKAVGKTEPTVPARAQ